MTTEALLFGLVLVGAVAFVFYAYVYAPKRMQEQAKAIALAELAAEAAEAKRRSELSPAQRRAEDQEAARKRQEDAERLQAEALRRKQYNLEVRFGKLVPALVCPHCQAKACVRRSTGKSDELVLDKSHTYKQKEQTRMRCDNCETEWSV